MKGSLYCNPDTQAQDLSAFKVKTMSVVFGAVCNGAGPTMLTCGVAKNWFTKPGFWEHCVDSPKENSKPQRSLNFPRSGPGDLLNLIFRNCPDPDVFSCF